MKRTINQSILELVQGDIVKQDTDAIVNAANQGLRGGSGVDGAIHRAGGPAIMAECREKYKNGCPVGDAKITTGGHLKAKYVIHAVGPIYKNGASGEAELLSSAYRRSLEVAVEHRLTSIAFPSISTGAYMYPVNQAAEIALTTCKEFLECHSEIQLVRFVLFDERTLHAYQSVLEKLMPDDSLPN